MAEYNYNDQRNGTYVNPEGTPGNISPVSNPNDNPGLDESYRGMTDETFRPSFSDLNNTYMFSSNGHDAREKFWGKYAGSFSYSNGNADIDDPIFTGFTLSIDRLNSPLFYTIGEYDGLASGRTRSDRSAFVRNISDEIENCLRNNYAKYVRGASNSYDISSILVKDEFPNGDNIGYGMQNNVYVDGIPYGATEYIYMVDKHTKDVGSSQDTGGHFSLGDGNATQSVLDNISKDDTEQQLAVIDGKISELEKFLNENRSEHQTNENDVNNIQSELERVQKEITETRNKIQTLSIKQDYKATFESKVYSELKDSINLMNNCIINLKPTGGRSTHSLNKYNEIVAEITILDIKLGTEIGKYNGNTSAVQALCPDIPTSVAQVTSCKITTTPVSDSSSYKSLPVDNGSKFDGSEAYKKGGKYKNLKVVVTVTTSGSASSELSTLKSKLNNLEAREKELIKNLENAEKKTNNDPYRQKEIELERAKEEKRSLQQSIEQANNDTSVASNGSGRVSPDGAMHTGDVYGGVQDDATTQNKNKSTLPMPPQTVYDMLGFIRGMVRLTTEYPYLLQSVTGLDEVYKNNYGVKDSFRGSKDNKITINIYESLDLKVSGMFNKYFNAVYDAQYRRERVPMNLRRFNCSIFVHDIRNFHMMSTKLGNLIRTEGNKNNISKIVEVALNTMSAIEFKFFGCEIIPEETGSIFENVSNAERGDMRMTNFSFSYSDVVINYLPFEDLKRSLLKKIDHTPSVKKNNVKIGNVNDNNKGGSQKIVSSIDNVNNKDKEGSQKKVFDISNVNNDDKYEKKPVDKSSQNYDVVKHGLYDRTPLGNVNNDDYDEFRYRRMREDMETTYKDKKINNVATYEAINSANENISASKHEFDLLFNQLATSVSASIGRERENVYNSYLEEIENIVFPGNDTDVVHTINYNTTPNNPNTTVELGSPQLNDINADIENGYVKTLGNVNDNDNLEPTPNVEENVVVVNGTSTSILNGVVTNLGDVLDDGYQGNTIQQIGDMLPDDTSVPKVEQLGNIYPEPVVSVSQGYIEDVLPDDPNNPVVENIYNVYPTLDATTTQGYIEDVLPDDPNMSNVNMIGNVYPVMRNPKTQGYIDDIIPDETIGKPIDKLNNVYPKPNPTKEHTGNVDKLGNINVKENASKILEKLDKLSEKKMKNKVIEDLGMVK
jgi:predicted  nucleic acid-binding Zn-ribbon protein